jgi:two-component system response regulator ChvI
MRGSVGLGVEDFSSEGAVQFASTTGPIRAVLVEDDDGTRRNLVCELLDQGISVKSFGDSASFLRWVTSNADADVVLISWVLPNTSGIDLLSQMRRKGVNLPVVFLAASGRATLAFHQGEIDMVDSVRGMETFARRLKQLAQPVKPAPELPTTNHVVRGKLVLKQNISRAYWDDKDVDLTLGEYNIVQLLASDTGRYTTYRAIYDRLHYKGFIAGSGEQGYRANVRSAIKRIRTKFRHCDANFDEIENYAGFGYCWRRSERLI